MQVNLSRRKALQRLHTATHVMNYAARKVLGHHVWQNGSQLRPEFGTLDITHYELPDWETLHSIEREANAVVFANELVKIEEIDRAEAERRYGYVIYQGGAVPSSELRVVHVGDEDIEACGGLHVRNTDEIGCIKFIDVQKIQDGVVRLKYCVQDYALALIQEREQYLHELEELYHVETAKVPQTAKKFFDEWKEQRKEIERLSERLITAYGEQFKNSQRDSATIEEDIDMKSLVTLFEEVLTQKSVFSLETPRFLATTGEKPNQYKKELPKQNYSIFVK